MSRLACSVLVVVALCSLAQEAGATFVHFRVLQSEPGLMLAVRQPLLVVHRFHEFLVALRSANVRKLPQSPVAWPIHCPRA